MSGAGEGETRVVILDLENLRVAKVLETGNRPKHGLVSPDGRRVGVDHWALSGGKLRLTFIRTEDDTIEKVLDIPVTNQPKGVTSMHNAWSWDSRYFFSVDRVDDRLVVVDTADWSVRTFSAPSVPHYPVVSPDGKELWLVHEGNDRVRPGIAVYDLTRPDLPIVAQVEMPLIGEDAVEAHHGNFTQDGRYFMALNRGPGNNLRGREVAFSAPVPSGWSTALPAPAPGWGTPTTLPTDAGSLPLTMATTLSPLLTSWVCAPLRTWSSARGAWDMWSSRPTAASLTFPMRTAISTSWTCAP